MPMAIRFSLNHGGDTTPLKLNIWNPLKLNAGLSLYLDVPLEVSTVNGDRISGLVHPKEYPIYK